mgnify:CR=1 FL=1
MLAPQQTIMRASAILRCKGAAAKLDCIWILNTLPFRGLRCANMQRRPEAKHCSSLCSQSEGDEYCGSQARAEIPTKLWPDALAMFATCSWPSLCEQSEGDEYCGGQARAKNPTKLCPDALAMFATCSWPSLCEQSELQCWRRNRRLCGPAQFSAARALSPNFNISF